MFSLILVWTTFIVSSLCLLMLAVEVFMNKSILPYNYKFYLLILFWVSSGIYLFG